jgi:hypothetical protein
MLNDGADVNNGTLLMSYLRKVSFSGATGLIEIQEGSNDRGDSFFSFISIFHFHFHFHFFSLLFFCLNLFEVDWFYLISSWQFKEIGSNEVSDVGVGFVCLMSVI